MNKEVFLTSLQELNIHLTLEQQTQLEQYYRLLVEWNEKMNLTGITAKEEVYLKHFYDSLTLARSVDLTKEATLCDVGTGAGFPGLVLKIVFPNLHVTLVDSLNKRLIFLNHVITELKLTNIQTVHSRAEDYAKLNREVFDFVTARAVAKLNILLEYMLPILKVNGLFIAMKANINDEISQASHALQVLNGQILKVDEFKLPIEESTRTLVIVQKNKITNQLYPRTSDKINKNPL